MTPHEIAKMIDDVRLAYPDAKTPVEALCLALSNARHRDAERLEALNLNARQASAIAHRDMTIKHLQDLLKGSDT